MLSTVPTLTSICEDALLSAKVEQCDLKPFNRPFINEQYLTRVSSDHDDNCEHALLLSPGTNFKQLFRISHLSVSHPSRASLWYRLLRQDQARHRHKFQQAVERYPEDIRNMFGRRNDISVRTPSCVDANHLPHYHLNRRGQNAVIRILSVFAYYHPDVTWAPLLGPIAALFLHYMTEVDTYESLLILTSTAYSVITQTEIQFQSLSLAFRNLLRRHCRATYDILLKHSQESQIFDDWLWIIFEHLPFPYLVSIVDCLLIEDMKILIRISMTLFHFFVKHCLSQRTSLMQSPRRESFFRRSKFGRASERLQKQISSLSNTTQLSVYDNLIGYIQHFDLPFEKVFKHAFGIHNLQRKEIFRTIEEEEEKIQMGRRRLLPRLHRSTSTSNHHPSNSTSIVKSLVNRTLHHQNSMPVIMVREFDTATASHSDFAYLWSLVPSRLADFQPERLYSSNIHGRRLRTLYDHVEYHQSCLIVIRNEKQEVFGAFCSGQLAHRTKTRTWFGTGESFLFTLKPERQVFKWVGFSAANKGSTQAYEDYFIYADDERLQIGGSKEPLSVGLVIQQDLNEGSTKACDTYASKPLSSVEHFQIMEIEVFGFAR